MIKKGTKYYSIINNKCPRCHQGDYYFSKNPYDFSLLGKMPDKCVNCGQSYQIEDGFYLGAMFVSYAIGVAIFITFWVATSVLFPEMTYWNQVIVEAIAIIVLFPVNFWFSRIIWINLNVNFNPNFNKS